MSKKVKIYITLLVLTVVAIVALEMTKPKDINWYPSYATHHKIPYGSYVFNKQLERLADSVINVERPPFEYLKNNKISGTYLFYNGGIEFGKPELNDLLEWTARGNTLIVSAVSFENRLLDTLNLKTKSINTFNNFNNAYQVQLVNQRLDSTVTYKFERPTTFFHFSEIDTLKTKVIGLIDKYESDDIKIKDALVNVVKHPFGKGEIILSTFPQAFTNYFILNSPNQNYTSGLMSYINMEQPIYLDSHYKNGKTFYTSPMYLFLNTKSLKWAYYIVLIGVLIYIIFEGKRKQRAIPIIKPLRNQTLDFTRTISNMYYENGKHKDIAQHKIQHFLEYIRNTMHLNTSSINDSFIKKLAARSNNTLEDTQTLFKFIEEINQSKEINNLQLERLNTLIETYKSNNKWKTKA